MAVVGHGHPRLKGELCCREVVEVESQRSLVLEQERMALPIARRVVSLCIRAGTCKPRAGESSSQLRATSCGCFQSKVCSCRDAPAGCRAIHPQQLPVVQLYHCFPLLHLRKAPHVTKREAAMFAAPGCSTLVSTGNCNISHGHLGPPLQRCELSLVAWGRTCSGGVPCSRGRACR